MKQVTRCWCVPSHRLYLLISFDAQIDKPPPLDFEAKIKKLLQWFWYPNHQNVAVGFEAKTEKPAILVSSTCMIQIAHGITRPPDHTITEYPTYAWSSPMLRTKSPTPTSIFVVACHVVFVTYTSWDKQTYFCTPNNLIWVSSTEKHRIQIQTNPN
jgi:hypothetical protein